MTGVTYWHVGTPGGDVVGIFTNDDQGVTVQLEKGQVAVARDAPLPNSVISAKGDGVSVRPQTLASAQRERWLAAKVYRATVMAAGCAAPLGGRVQTDPVSRAAIDQAATEAITNQTNLSWSIDWVMADNSVVKHNAAQMLALHAAVRTRISACQARSQAIRKTIFAAATVAAVAAIDITAGYPA